MTNVKLAKSGHDNSDSAQAQAPVPLSSLLPHMKPPKHTPTHCYKTIDLGMNDFYFIISYIILFIILFYFEFNSNSH